MSEEYRRLEATKDAEREIADLQQNHSVSSAADLAALEHRTNIPAVRPKVVDVNRFHELTPWLHQVAALRLNAFVLSGH